MNAVKELTPEQLEKQRIREFVANGTKHAAMRIHTVVDQIIEADKAIEDDQHQKSVRVRQSYFHTCYRLLYLYYKGIIDGNTKDGWLETSTALIMRQTKCSRATVQRHLKKLSTPGEILEEPLISERIEGGDFKHYNYRLKINPFYLLAFEAEAELEAAEAEKQAENGKKMKKVDTTESLLRELSQGRTPTAIEKVLMVALSGKMKSDLEPPPD